MSLPPSNPGKAYLVGAGPGDPELMTLKAQRILSQADVVLYDFLVDSRILALSKPQAEKIYVGKSGLMGHHLSQEEIEALLVEKCQAGKVVCRLKGGDPYIFGRGGEEGERLSALGIPFEVVPGISSAVAAPAYAGIPVTHRDFASAVSFITGHEDPNKPESMLDWETLAKMTGTLVFLMGTKQLPHIVSRLAAFGKPPETPVALVQWGTRPQQKSVTGTLETIVAQLEANPLLPPCVIVVGDVVRLQPVLNWYESLPLFGKTVVVTRARTQASSVRSQLESLGAEVIEFPTIEIKPPQDPEAVSNGMAKVSGYDWVIFTSPNGVIYGFEALHRVGLDARALGGVKIAAIGPATAEALQQQGLKPDLIPREYVAEAIFEALTQVEPALSGKRFLLPRADIARDALTRALEEAGAVADELSVYQTVCATQGPEIDELLPRLQEKSVDVITFSSSSTVTHFAERLDTALQEAPSLLDGVLLASIGPITSQTLRERFGRVDIEAPVHTIPGLIEAIRYHFQTTKPQLEAVR